MKSPESVETLTKMREMRLACEREISQQQEEIDSLRISYGNRFESVKSSAQRTIVLQEKLRKLKSELRKDEEDLSEALAGKARKEAKRVAIAESIALTKEKVTELKEVVEGHKAKKNKYCGLISEQSKELSTLQEKLNQGKEHRDQMEEAISWYNRVLGFRIETGHGVKFIFTNISRQSPDKEYSFVILLDGNVYKLLECNPSLDAEELVEELNKSNQFFKFVGIMRQRFQEAASHEAPSRDGLSATVSSLVAVSPESNEDRHYSPGKKGLPSSESKSSASKVIKAHKIQSPGSASVRRSARLKKLTS